MREQTNKFLLVGLLPLASHLGRSVQRFQREVGAADPAVERFVAVLPSGEREQPQVFAVAEVAAYHATQLA
ncbi:hypothetical protein Pla175_30100 [Pirellulimonas nuda]|uniref:Uncharacterized protein n=1 Tax=Pirellulimonas nuda TaxID=2528009 RepID=A0A518DDR8_9BACT|nr:hypothetical protein Pla175_30100 [Pirellulimonas nuda]